MELTMRSMVTAGTTACLAVLLLGGMTTDESTSASSESRDAGVPIEQIITTVARKTGKKYVLDPRTHFQVRIIGQDPSSITYPELLTILQVNGFIAVEGGGYIRVLPDANARQVAEPQLSNGQTYPDAQFVSDVITVKNSPAGYLVPIIRPLLPQMAHLAAYPCSNSLLIVDSFGNLKRIEAIVRALDIGTPYKPVPCEGPIPGAHHDAPTGNTTK
jgi:type II secretory pathway component GspD/PulD (secretin)